MMPHAHTRTHTHARTRAQAVPAVAVLRGAGLSQLIRLEGLLAMRVLDLSGNALEGTLVGRDGCGGDFGCLPLLEELSLSGNLLTSLHGISLPCENRNRSGSILPPLFSLTPPP